MHTPSHPYLAQYYLTLSHSHQQQLSFYPLQILLPSPCHAVLQCNCTVHFNLCLKPYGSPGSVRSSMINADFCTGAVLISFGAVLGKTSPVQLLVMAMFEVTLFAINEYILLSLLGVSNILVIIHNKKIHLQKSSM